MFHLDVSVSAHLMSSNSGVLVMSSHTLYIEMIVFYGPIDSSGTNYSFRHIYNANWYSVNVLRVEIPIAPVPALMTVSELIMEVLHNLYLLQNHQLFPAIGLKYIF